MLLGAMVVTAVAALSAPSGKVAFLKGNELMVAGDDGSGARALTSDKVPKQGLRWSPGGSQIAYRIAGSQMVNPKTHASIVVVPAQGGNATTVPVLSMEADGTIVGGMRFVEESGWYSDTAVFASGSANPHVAEYRIMDVASRTVTDSYFGFDFATCAAMAKVAYGVEERGGPTAGTVHIEVNGKQIYATRDEGGLRGLRWSDTCDRLAFLEGEGNHIKFVVLKDSKVEAKIDLRGVTGEQSITTFQNQFLLPAHAGGSAYDSATRSVKPAPAVMETFRKRSGARDAVLERLGGKSAVWWEPAK